MSSDKKNRAIDRQIDDNLRRIFEEDVEAGLPAHLRRLIEKLDEAGSSSDTDETDGGEMRGASRTFSISGIPRRISEERSEAS